MSTRFESREALAAKIAWEGGLIESLDYGIRPEDMPEGDTELAEAWKALYDAYQVVDRLADKVDELLPELE